MLNFCHSAVGLVFGALKGSSLAYLAALLYVNIATGLGLLISRL